MRARQVLKNETAMPHEPCELRRISRRKCLRQAGKLLALAAAPGAVVAGLGGCGSSVRDTRAKPSSIRVGLLHSLTGTMAISETSLCDAELLAIEEINAAGGVLGHQIEPLVADGRSRFIEVFPRQARRLLVEEKAAVVFGCWTSASRRAVLPVFEELNGLLFYPVQYEGNESSRNIVYAGAVPNQQILPAIDWLLSEAGGKCQRFYLLGSDYIFPRTANLIIRKQLQSHGLQPTAERYVPLGEQNFQQVVANIRELGPDIVISTINGSSNLGFYAELTKQAMSAAQFPVLATSVGEDELRNLSPGQVEGHLAAWTYFQSVDSPSNRDFVSKFKREFGQDCVTDDPIEAAFSQVFLWKLAVEQAGSFEVDRVRAAFLSGIEFDAPGGRIAIDAKTQHTTKRFRLGRIRHDRQFEVIHQSDAAIAPDPYPEVAFPGWHCDWTKGGLVRGADVKIGS